jgi:hypothetical protein
MGLGLFKNMFLKGFNSKISLIIPTIKDKIQEASVLYSNVTGIFNINSRLGTSKQAKAIGRTTQLEAS